MPSPSPSSFHSQLHSFCATHGLSLPILESILSPLIPHLHLCPAQGGCSLTLIRSPCPSRSHCSHKQDTDNGLHASLLPQFEDTTSTTTTATLSYSSECNKSKQTILQLRPQAYALDPVLCTAAHAVYGRLAPEARIILSLPCVQIVELELLPGNPASALLPLTHTLGAGEEEKLGRLLGDLAGFFARGFYSVRPTGKGAAAPGTFFKGDSGELTGKVGRTMDGRLERLAADLPSRSLRESADRVRRRVMEDRGLVGLPVVLTHGDPLPSNFLLDGRWRLAGVVDWAEAECLPFGVGLHGIEHFLGSWKGTGRGRGRWRFYASADRLREWFWWCLGDEVPELRQGDLMVRVRLARDVGVLLWHGFAWDQGRIDRVVDRGDREELEYLQAFLSTTDDDDDARPHVTARI